MSDLPVQWKWVDASLQDDKGKVILTCEGSQPSDELKRLIASAPELLAACEAAMLLADDNRDLPDNGEFSGAAIGDQIYSAIAKAKRQSP